MSTVFNTGLPAGARLTLQCCRQCGLVNYPVRELCGNCLADELHWQPVAASGVIQSLVQLHYSLEPGFAAHLPWTVASVRLDCGPVVLAHLQPGPGSGDTIELRVVRDGSGNHMLVALGTDTPSQQAAAGWLASIDFEEVPA
jgi:uncharacterized OB-fold protein